MKRNVSPLEAWGECLMIGLWIYCACLLAMALLLALNSAGVPIYEMMRSIGL